jgi:Na+-driven multidrug efflux pump
MGIPAMGVKGAAIATTVSRFVELLILVIWTHTHTDRCPYAGGLYTTFKIPVPLLKIVSIKGLPLLFNELAWSMAITLRNQFYSTRGLDALAATSISTTIINMFSVVYMALGTSVAIMVGNKLGAGDVAGAKDTSKKLIAFSFFTAICVGSIIVATAPLFPKLYDVSVGVREIATFILIANGILVLVQAVAHSSYFTIRSGGRVLVTVLLDCGFMWGFVIPFSLAMTYLTGLDIRWLFVLCQSTEIIKVIIGFIILKKVNWAKKLV